MGTLHEKCPCFFGDIMNNEEILKIAMRQSAIESGFKPAWVQRTVKTEEYIRNVNK